MVTNLTTSKLILPYPINKIKGAIDNILKTSSYSLLEKDDLLNSYKFYIYTGDSGLIKITLDELEQTKILCNTKITNIEGIAVSETTLIELKDSFINTLTDLLDGKIAITKKWKNKTRKTIIESTYLIIIVTIVIIGFIFWKHYML